MPAPRLIHPVPIWVKKIDRDFTPISDPNLHEFIGQVRRERKVKLYAQIGQPSVTPKASSGGILETEAGYILVLTAALRNADVALERGDQIVQIGEGPAARQTDLYITRLEWLGHYNQASGHTMLKAYFADRQPSRQQGDL